MRISHFRNHYLVLKQLVRLTKGCEELLLRHLCVLMTVHVYVCVCMCVCVCVCVCVGGGQGGVRGVGGTVQDRQRWQAEEGGKVQLCRCQGNQPHVHIALCSQALSTVQLLIAYNMQGSPCAFHHVNDVNVYYM